MSFRVGVSDQGGSSTVASQINFSVVAAITSAQTTSSLDLSNDTTLVIAAGGTLTVTDSVEIGSGATLDIESGGTLILSNLVQGTGAATLLLEGGTLEANGAFTSIMPIVIGAGGGTVNTNGYNVTLAGNLSSAASTGTLIKMGAGTLTFSGVNNYTGGTSVQAGALVMASPSAASSSGILTVGPGTLVVLGATTIASPAAANTSTSTAATQTNAETNTTADTATATLTATPTGTATDTTADRTTGAPAAPSPPVSPPESPVNADLSGSQAAASPATMVSNAAKVEGINAFDDASAAARPSALVTSVAWTTVTANTSISDGGAVASEDYARAHDVVLQSRRVGSSGIEAWDAAGSVDSSDKLHSAGKHGPIEALVDAALVALVV